MSGELISRVAIDRQAKQDAFDASRGYTVSNPYPTTHDAHTPWQVSFETHLIAFYCTDWELL